MSNLRHRAIRRFPEIHTSPGIKNGGRKRQRGQLFDMIFIGLFFLITKITYDHCGNIRQYSYEQNWRRLHLLSNVPSHLQKYTLVPFALYPSCLFFLISKQKLLSGKFWNFSISWTPFQVTAHRFTSPFLPTFYRENFQTYRKIVRIFQGTFKNPPHGFSC